MKIRRQRPNAGREDRLLGPRLSLGALLTGVVVWSFCTQAPVFAFPSGHPEGSPQSLSSSSTEVKTTQLLSLRLIPQQIVLQGATASQRIVVIGKYADGLERDATAQSHFSLSD